ncbi:MAG TPA: hypothetical protein VKB58_16880 [Terriglobales bacterium]|nr:hypothetical protein [Terriglobales bacterium]
MPQQIVQPLLNVNDHRLKHDGLAPLPNPNAITFEAKFLRQVNDLPIAVKGQLNDLSH